MTVTSKDNQWVKEWRGLCDSAKKRRESGLFALEGARLCGDALRSGVAIKAVLYTASALAIYTDVVGALLAAADTVVEISPELSRHMGDTTNPQGVFCIAKTLDNSLIIDKINIMGIYGALEDVQDPGNLGTIIRTAEAFGLSGLILSEGCCDVYNPKVLRSSMGGVFRLPLMRVRDMAETVTALQAKGLTANACVVDASAMPITEAGLGAGTVAVIGNEGNGLKPATVAACRQAVTIPMNGRAESLNASMAAGIILWEMTRPK
ncbi:MAG: RNA methyltransferase [Ruminococcaceae bacterium]|nr:RNA methyltransferase [Oscillospiraceae bacterium]